jgi:hypothetical protein
MARKAATTAGDLQRFVPAMDFTGYPFGQPVAFRAGVESIPVPAEFVQLMHAKNKVQPQQMEMDT